jgi:hypothetical protein
MTIDFKGIFRNKNHQQLKINNLERLESRRWANIIDFEASGFGNESYPIEVGLH